MRKYALIDMKHTFVNIFYKTGYYYYLFFHT